MKNIFPEVDIKYSCKKRITKHSIDKHDIDNYILSINLETWVRIKYKKKWYEIMVFDKMKVFCAGRDLEDINLKEMLYFQNEFNKKSINMKEFYILDKKFIRREMEKGAIRKSSYPYSEKSRLHNLNYNN